ncbi:MAG: NAD-dependent epimerase/dehydratase family protein [Bacteroidetes bacterium]|nr:MAG: NAD-dependent epimerase/dehydratase family protein [Bacteroidota bacterium]
MNKNILVMGAVGQIGSELTTRLREIYGDSRVIASDIRLPSYDILQEGPFEIHDATDGARTAAILAKHKIGLIYNLPALLSATAEQFPQKAFEVNLVGLHRTLEAARAYSCAVFTPSTIGVFGANTPKELTPQDTIMRPHTMYGVTKVAGELLCDYYYYKYGLDVRGVRYPGIISNKTLPGGGTTDYAVEIFYKALEKGTYTSYLRADTQLDMMYMPDALHAAIQLMEADPTRLRHRNAFNVTAMNFDVQTLAAEIQKHLPNFTVNYCVDPMRQAIADSWPNRLDDSEARKQWNWQAAYDLPAMTSDMLNALSDKIGKK